MKLQAIEEALQSINEATFQNLCDALLFADEVDFSEIHRIGSVKGKQKTRKGRPDALFVKPNGRYLFAEYTTMGSSHKRAFYKKLKKDLAECFDETITNIKVDKIERIILCYNTTLDASMVEGLKQMTAKKNVTLQLVGLDNIALKLFGTYKHLAREFLGISIDTGQILSPKIFIKEYEKANLATPLNTRFYYREKELAALLDQLHIVDLVMLAGSAGVGKSRLALEGLYQFKQLHKGYTLYCITSKNANILEDLRTYLKEGRNYLLLIDDAHRQVQNFLTVLATFRESRKGKLKIVFTVRDYARAELFQKCRQYNPGLVVVKKMDPDQIDTLLREEFGLAEAKVRRRIQEIAKGNPRLALMAARIYPHKGWAALSDVSSLYEEYFQTFVDDKDLFANPHFVKTLGIISFFYSLDLTDESFCKNICSLFELDYHSFIEMAFTIEAHELVDIYAKEVVRINDQVLSTYFFYTAFIKKKALRIDLLFRAYFPTYTWRFKDALLAADNTFGAANVLDALTPILDDYWKTIKTDNEKALKFLEIMGPNKADRFFAYVYESILKIKIAKKPVYSFEGNQSFPTMIDQLWSILQSFLATSGDKFQTTLLLCFEYVKRYPQAYTDLVKAIKEHVSFDGKDEEWEFSRQLMLLNEISGQPKCNKLATALFFDLFTFFMQACYQGSRYNHMNNSMQLYTYQLNMHPMIVTFRERMWRSLEAAFVHQPQKSISVLLNYITRNELDKNTCRHDQPFIRDIIIHQLSPEEFGHAYFVHSYLAVLKRRDVYDSFWDDIEVEFTTPTYELFLILDWSYIRRKETFHLKIDFAQLNEIKEKEIRTKIQLNTLADFNKLYKEVKGILSFSQGQYSNIHTSLDICLSQLYEQNPSLGIQALQEIIREGNTIGLWPILIFKAIQQKGLSSSDALFQQISISNYNLKEDWQFRFFNFLPQTYITSRYAAAFLAHCKEAKEVKHLWLDDLQKLAKIRPSIYIDVLQLLVTRRAAEHDFTYNLDNHFIRKNIERLSGHVDLLKKAYLQQEVINHHYDYDFADFMALLKADASFLKVYIEFIYQQSDYVTDRGYERMCKVWEHPQAPSLIYGALVQLAKLKDYWAGDHFANAFFNHLPFQYLPEAKRLIKKFITAHKSSRTAINMIMDVTRNSLADFYQEAIAHLLTKNQSFAFFQKIRWLNNHFSSNGSVSWSEVRSGEWEAILVTIQTLPAQYKYVQHINAVRDSIQIEMRNLAWERKRQFLDEHYWF